MVVHHWSDDGLVMYHRGSLVKAHLEGKICNRQHFLLPVRTLYKGFPVNFCASKYLEKFPFTMYICSGQNEERPSEGRWYAPKCATAWVTISPLTSTFSISISSTRVRQNGTSVTPRYEVVAKMVHSSWSSWVPLHKFGRVFIYFRKIHINWNGTSSTYPEAS